jgi:hypothetical protein
MHREIRRARDVRGNLTPTSPPLFFNAYIGGEPERTGSLLGTPALIALPVGRVSRRQVCTARLP